MITDWLPIVGSLLVAPVLYLLLQRWLRKKRLPPGTCLPPGPKGIPFLGHLQFASKDFHCNQAIKWAKQYGPVYRIKTGSTDVVIISDFQLIKKYLPRKELMNRPQNWFFKEGEYGGVATYNGEEWDENRKFCMQVLRDLGYGKTSMEEHVQDECTNFLKKISSTNGTPILIEKDLLTSISSNIASLVYATRHDHDDPHRLFMDKMLLEVFEAIGSGSMLEFLPLFVRQLLRKLPSTRRSTMVSSIKELIQYTLRQAEEHNRSLDNNYNRDFIDGYLKKIKEHEKNPTSYFTILESRRKCCGTETRSRRLRFARSLVGNAMALFFGGSGTVSLTLHWHFLNFADKQDTVQARVHKEIDQVVGKERQPKWEDRLRMPYTMACIWEMNRWKTVSPLGVPRCVLEDTLFDEFYIPKGTTVLPNLWAVHNDPRLWREPSKFDPDRFLREDGSLAQPKPDYLIPFSIGKRMCPGEILSLVEIFLYITNVLQKYRILPEEGEIIKGLNSVDAVIQEVAHYKLRFVPR